MSMSLGNEMGGREGGRKRRGREIEKDRGLVGKGKVEGWKRKI